MSAARKYLASKTSPRKLRPTLYFTMNCLLLTKAEGTAQNGDPLPQEDVDGYLQTLRDQFEAQWNHEKLAGTPRLIERRGWALSFRRR